jgi:hypothetical protein
MAGFQLLTLAGRGQKPKAKSQFKYVNICVNLICDICG